MAFLTKNSSTVWYVLNVQLYLPWLCRKYKGCCVLLPGLISHESEANYSKPKYFDKTTIIIMQSRFLILFFSSKVCKSRNKVNTNNSKTNNI